MVGNYLQIRHDPPAVNAWKAQTREVLTQKGYEGTLINEHLRAIEIYAEFLQRMLAAKVACTTSNFPPDLLVSVVPGL